MTMPLSLHHEYMGLVLQVRLLLRQKTRRIAAGCSYAGATTHSNREAYTRGTLTVRAYRAVCAVRKLKQRSQPGPNG